MSLIIFIMFNMNKPKINTIYNVMNAIKKIFFPTIKNIKQNNNLDLIKI